jgi:hypothetical protein
VFQNRLALYLLLMAVEFQFFTINLLNARLRQPTDGWELKIDLIDNHLTPHPVWLIPYFIGFFFASLIPLWALLHMPIKLYRQFILSLVIAGLFSYTIYILVPTYVTKPSPDDVPGHSFFAERLRDTYRADAAASSHNAAPSQHVFYALLNMCFMIRWRPQKRVFVFWSTLATLIVASTLLTQRHNTPDLISGYLVAVAAYYAGCWLGARVTARLSDEDAPIALSAFTRRVQDRLRRRSARRAGVDTM